MHLGKFRVVYEEEREPCRAGGEGYFLRQRAVVHLSDVRAGLKPALIYTVLCDDAQFRKAAGKRPSPLQYFIASLGFCMFSRMACFASRMDVSMDDAEVDLRMAYDLGAMKRLTAFATAAQELSYFLQIKSPATTKNDGYRFAPPILRGNVWELVLGMVEGPVALALLPLTYDCRPRLENDHVGATPCGCPIFGRQQWLN